MDWKELGSKIIGAGANVLGGLVAGGPVGAGLAAVKVLASEFGVDTEVATHDPGVLARAIELSPEHRVRLVEIEGQTKVALQQIALEHHRTEVERERQALLAHTAQVRAVNETIRTELTASDGYRAGWRPFWGYASGLAWFLQSVLVSAAVVYVAVVEPANAGSVLNGVATAVGAMTVQWGLALGVLGVAVVKRSADKELAAGLTPRPGILGAIASRIAEPGGTGGAGR